MQDTLTLYELNNLVHSVLEDTMDGEYWLLAELSEARLATNGHFYVEFVQKDAAGRNFVARARGTIWSRTYQLLAPLFERATGERLRAGLTVRVQVTVSFHELYGYSLNILDIDPSYTLGAMARRRREILQQLEADGILHDNQQLPLPPLLKRIAVVSSATAAGYGDFCNQLAHNDYGLAFEVRLFPAVMQGVNVEASVLAALSAILDEADAWDCVVLIRGGGSSSDLSDFDTYALAAAVAQMPLPVIVGIGHERDQTVLDSVAHTTVKTPTAAAAFLIDHGAQQLARLDALRQRLSRSTLLRMQRSHTRLQQLTASLPRAFVLLCERGGRRLDNLSARLTAAPRHRLLAERHALEQSASHIAIALTRQTERTRFRLELLAQKLQALNPQHQLARGYSLLLTSDGRLVRSVEDVSVDQTVIVRLCDGEVRACIEDKSLCAPVVSGQ
ncbi:MAG: exodeoxyribonuclease VII large subunit [Bacteroidaceae bacterium]|nr:exodeoxyribonuclease VII large subunit [Bacteroidaceae bacterium]